MRNIMYRVIVVDDETIVRIAIQNIINWEDYDMTFVGSASNGKKALELVAEKQPDIVITDLVMNDIDGLELIKLLKKAGYVGKVIVLSNYSEFEMVKETLRFGAFDYILKNSLNGANLLEVLEAAKKSIAEERKTGTIVTKISQENSILQYQNANITRQLRRNILGDSYDLDLLRKYYPNQGYCLLYLKNDEELTTVDNPKYAYIDNIVEDVLGHVNYLCTIYIKNGSYVILCNGELLKMPFLFEKVISSLKIYTNNQFMIGVSTEFNEIQGIQHIFEEVAERMKYLFYEEENDIFNMNNYTEEKQFPVLSKELKLNMTEDLFDAINRSDEEWIRCKVQEVKDDCSSVLLDPDLLKKWLEVNIAQMMAQFDIQDGSVKNQIEEISENICNTQRLSKAMNYLESACFCIVEYTNSKIKSPEVQQVLEYIEKHYEKRLSLQFLAKYVNLSPSYLTRVFKKETGQTISDYINEYKINKATDLLADNSMLIKEVAHSVGIVDQFYFSKLFKKYKGETPSQYCDRIHN